MKGYYFVCNTVKLEARAYEGNMLDYLSINLPFPFDLVFSSTLDRPKEYA